MAFCTNCGAQVSGAFCVQCGNPTKSSGQAAAPPLAPSPPAHSYAAQTAAPQQGQSAVGPTVTRKTNPIVWVLVVVAGLIVLSGLGVLGISYFAYYKAKQAGFDPDLMSRNPGLAASKILAAVNPDVDIVKTDEAAGMITVRDKKTGQTATITFDEVKKAGRIRFTTEGEHREKATMEVGGEGKLPSWVPNYPGSTANPQFTIKGDASDASGEAGSVTFSTSDLPSKVMSFYEQRIKELGMKVNLTTSGGEGGMVVAADESNHRGLTIIVAAGGSEGTGVNLTYTTKK